MSDAHLTQGPLPIAMRRVCQAHCPVCGEGGTVLYQNLEDHLYHAPGHWIMSRCANSACGALWLSEAPHPEDLAIAYQNYYTHSADSSAAAPVPSQRSRIKEALVRRRFGYPEPRNIGFALFDVALRALLPGTIEAAYYQHLYVPWQPGGRLLEIGCGAGNQLLVLRQAGWQVAGVDFDPEAVATARRRGLEVHLGDVRSLKLDHESFDAIVMGHVVEHTYDPIEVLKECRRLLSPNGVIIAVTPNADALGHRLYKDAWRGLEPPRHLVVFTPRALRLAFRMAGFQPKETRYSARDSTNMLNLSASIRAIISGRRANLRLSKLVTGLERVGAWIGISWAEEQILLAHRGPDRAGLVEQQPPSRLES